MENKHTQQVDFSNPTADKITSTSTISIKQETLGEDLKFPLIIENGMDYLNLTTKIFINGAKWQQEKSYSEEDMVKFAEFVATYLDKNRNVNGEMLHAKSKYDGAERTIDLLQVWFEKFKKK